jgi:molybdopterin-binding protein
MSLLTVRQAAGRLGVGYSTLKQWIYQGRVRTRTTSGGHHRIPEAEVDRLLAPTTIPREPARASRARTGVAEAPGVIVVLSGRNQLHGYVDEVRVHGLLAQVRLRIGDQVLTAIITRDAVDELKLRRGDDALAIVKSTEVMIARQSRRSRQDERGRKSFPKRAKTERESGPLFRRRARR